MKTFIKLCVLTIVITLMYTCAYSCLAETTLNVSLKSNNDNIAKDQKEITLYLNLKNYDSDGILGYEATLEYDKEVFEEEVKQTNKNGLVVLYKNLIRVFIPISLSEVGRDEDVSSYKGKIIRFRVIENDERAKKIIGSVKDLVEEEKKAKEEKFWNNIEVGKKYTGTVTAISDYGAFVDIGGAQGLLHISEMTWGRNQNPRDILEVGQSIEVSVKELDKENKRFKLSYEKKGPNPWNKVEEKYHVGDVVKVKISKIMPFGAFAELEKGIEGLIHISQICERKIAKPEEELQVGQKVNAKIINIDFENKKIELSIRELEGTSQEYKENA